MQWTIAYPSAAITSIAITTGPQATVASKSLNCNNRTGSASCLLTGLNTNKIQNGVVAVATLAYSSATGVPTGIQLMNALGASPSDAAIPVAAVTSITVIPAIKSLQCSPASLTAPATASCTVTLTGAAPSPGVNVSIGTAATGVTITNLTSVTVATGQTSAVFSLNVTGATAAGSVIVTASENGSSASASFNVTLPASSQPSTIRVHAGGSQYVDGSGNVWSADTGYTGGSTYRTTAPISATSSPALYQTERFASGTLHYQFSVSNGTYAVKLKFAEIYFTQAGRRVFNVSINGRQVLTNFDIITQAGGPNIAVDRQYTVNVTGGQVAIDFTALVNNGQINAIEIVPGQAFSPIRTSAGATSAYTDPQGHVWAADYGYSGGTITTTTSSISNTATPVIYQRERWKDGGFTYTFSVPNGTHTLTLKFAEIHFTLPGQRVFNVSINGQSVLSNFDILAQAGGALRAVDRNFSFNVTGGTVSIQFTPGPVNNPSVNAIQIQ